jgi:hypothetical protein
MLTDDADRADVVSDEKAIGDDGIAAMHANKRRADSYAARALVSVASHDDTTLHATANRYAERNA